MKIKVTLITIITLALFLTGISAPVILAKSNSYSDNKIELVKKPKDPPWDPGEESDNKIFSSEAIPKVLLAKKPKDPPWDPGDETHKLGVRLK